MLCPIFILFILIEQDEECIWGKQHKNQFEITVWLVDLDFADDITFLSSSFQHKQTKVPK